MYSKTSDQMNYIERFQNFLSYMVMFATTSIMKIPIQKNLSPYLDESWNIDVSLLYFKNIDYNC